MDDGYEVYTKFGPGYVDQTDTIKYVSALNYQCLKRTCKKCFIDKFKLPDLKTQQALFSIDEEQDVFGISTLYFQHHPDYGLRWHLSNPIYKKSRLLYIKTSNGETKLHYKNDYVRKKLRHLRLTRPYKLTIYNTTFYTPASSYEEDRLEETRYASPSEHKIYQKNK